MTKERLIEMMDLVLSCKHWGHSHSVDIEIDNAGDHEIYIYPNVGNGGKAKVYESHPIIPIPENDDTHVYDPNFEKAEAEIRRLLQEIKKP